MYFFTREEDLAIANAVQYMKRTLTHYRYAQWFDGWDTPLMRDGALRSYIAMSHRMGDKPNDDNYTALAKYHHTIDPRERCLIITELPKQGIGGTLSSIVQMYREHHYEFAGAWLHMQNEITIAALAIATGGAAPIPPSVLAECVYNVRIQHAKEITGVCKCGMRAASTMCALCGAKGK